MYWKPAPWAPCCPTHRRELYYDDRHRCRGEVEQFDGPEASAYANIPGRRSGAMASWEAAKRWVEQRTLRVVK